MLAAILERIGRLAVQSHDVSVGSKNPTGPTSESDRECITYGRQLMSEPALWRGRRISGRPVKPDSPWREVSRQIGIPRSSWLVSWKEVVARSVSERHPNAEYGGASRATFYDHIPRALSFFGPKRGIVHGGFAIEANAFQRGRPSARRFAATSCGPRGTAPGGGA